MSKRLMLIIMAGAFLCLPLASAWAGELHVPTEVVYHNPTSNYNGVTLFTPIKQNYTSTGKTISFLIDMDGRPVHYWTKNSTTETIFDARLEAATDGTGTLSRSCVLAKPVGVDPTNTLQGTYGGCGAIEEVNWDGSVANRYLFYNTQYRSHDDYMKIYNTKLNRYTYLVLVWEAHTKAEALAAGASGVVPANWSLDAIYEYDPSVNAIVWKWSFINHLTTVQDPTKFNINTLSTTRQAPTVDWMHCNSISYNYATGHIVINSREFNELFVIDHDTTFTDTSNWQANYAAAAGTGGDFLYRFGCPHNYNSENLPSFYTTTTSPYWNQSNNNMYLFGAHGATFVPANAWGYQAGPAMTYANAAQGDIMVFNNGVNGLPGMQVSKAWEINPHVTGYSGGYKTSSGYYTETSDTVPGTVVMSNGSFNMTGHKLSRQLFWAWQPGFSYGLQSSYLGAIQRLPNGNTLIVSGETGHMLEVNYGWTTSQAFGGTATTFWEYLNPINNGVPFRYHNFDGSDNGGYSVNRAYRYVCDSSTNVHPVFSGHLTFTGNYTATASPYAIVTTPSETAPLAILPAPGAGTTLTGNRVLPFASGGLANAQAAIPVAYQVDTTTTDSRGIGAPVPSTSSATVIRR